VSEIKSNNNGSGGSDGLDPAATIPESLARFFQSNYDLRGVRAHSEVDLDDSGRYVDGHLILMDDSLGHFVRDNGTWNVNWVGFDKFNHSEIVEAIGMNLLRLIDDSGMVAQYRCTLRHGKSVAGLHRRLEKLQGVESTDEHESSNGQGGMEEEKVRCDKCDRVIPAWTESCPACLSRRKILWRLLDFLKPYKKRALVGGTVALFIAASGLVQPWLIKPIIDDGIKGGNFDLVLRYVVVMAGLLLVSSLGQILQARMLFGLGTRVSRDIRTKIYGHLHKLSLGYFSKKQTGGLVTRVTTDSDRIWRFIAYAAVDVVLGLLTVVGVGVALFLMNWKLAIFALLPLPLMIGLLVFFHNRMHKVFRRMFHRWSRMTAVVADALPGVRVIKAFGQEDREIDRFGKQNTAVFDEEMKFVTQASLYAPMMMFCSQVGMLIIWLLGGYWAVNGDMKTGTLVAFTMYMGMFMRPIHMIAHMDQMFNRAATAAQRIFEVIDTEPTIFTRQGSEGEKELEGKIELRNVSFSYDGVRKVLKGVNLTVEPGQTIGLAGPSGGGKTMMVNLICRFYDALEGQVAIDGVDVRDHQVESLRRQVGVVLQEPFLFHGTVGENIAYGNSEATGEQIIVAARAANAHEFIVGFADGYDTLVGERGQSLSGGERQRISIARAILNNPRILILDEATSSVDTETEKLIQQALDRLVKNRTTIAIAHRLSTLRKADRLVILEKGKVVEEGSHEELAALDGGLYAKLLSMQSELQSAVPTD